MLKDLSEHEDVLQPRDNPQCKATGWIITHLKAQISFPSPPVLKPSMANMTKN